jgi:hypothetical protein
VEVDLTVSVLVVGSGVTVVPISNRDVLVSVTVTIGPVVVVKMVVLTVEGMIVVIVDVDSVVDDVEDTVKDTTEELGTVTFPAVNGVV